MCQNRELYFIRDFFYFKIFPDIDRQIKVWIIEYEGHLDSVSI